MHEKDYRKIYLEYKNKKKVSVVHCFTYNKYKDRLVLKKTVPIIPVNSKKPMVVQRTRTAKLFFSRKVDGHKYSDNMSVKENDEVLFQSQVTSKTKC